MNTRQISTFLISLTAMIEIAVIIKRLKAADPTIVFGPSSPGSSSIQIIVSRTASIISGADDPRAISVRFATVAFQTVFSTIVSLPKSSVSTTNVVYAVISSIDSMKRSDTIAIPRNMQDSIAPQRIIKKMLFDKLKPTPIILLYTMT